MRKIYCKNYKKKCIENKDCKMCKLCKSNNYKHKRYISETKLKRMFNEGVVFIDE